MNDKMKLFALRIVFSVILCCSLMGLWKIAEIKMYGFSQYSALDKYMASVLSFLLACVLIRKDDIER